MHSGVADQNLRCGFTTGTAAAAAVKGALTLLATGAAPSVVQIRLPTGDVLVIPIRRCASDRDGAVCSVIKDAGDDPDVTHRAEIGARVRMRKEGGGRIAVTGGEGVGRVTKPGLEVPPGEAAINPGPMAMIREAVHDVLPEGLKNSDVRVEIFVPEGARIAEKTLNRRLGILGGISILGTTGLVKPMSHDAYTATIRSAMAVAAAAGLDEIVLSTGRRSERHAQALLPHLPEEAFVQMGDFFRFAMETAAERRFPKAVLAVFFGKALKMAQGLDCTHAAKAAMNLSALSRWAGEITGDAGFSRRLAEANTARQALGMILPGYPDVADHVGNRVLAAAKTWTGNADMEIGCVIFDYEGNVIFRRSDATGRGPA